MGFLGDSFERSFREGIIQVKGLEIGNQRFRLVGGDDLFPILRGKRKGI
jgi:hypothetical protein